MVLLLVKKSALRMEVEVSQSIHSNICLHVFLLLIVITESSFLYVQGSLRERSKFWKEELEASQFVLDIVTNGYLLPFIALPQEMVAKNHSSALKKSKFVSDSIDELVQSHCVRESVCVHYRKYVAPFK